MMMSLSARRNQERAVVVYPDMKIHEGQSSKFVFQDMKRIVIAAVGMSLDLYPGPVHPAEEGTDDRQRSENSEKIAEAVCLYV